LVGAAVLGKVGRAVGVAVGDALGRSVGATVGWAVGDAVGRSVGTAVGCGVGSCVGLRVGDGVGAGVHGKRKHSRFSLRGVPLHPRPGTSTILILSCEVGLRSAGRQAVMHGVHAAQWATHSGSGVGGGVGNARVGLAVGRRVAQGVGACPGARASAAMPSLVCDDI
jgi:hypothetical protein